MIQNMEREFFSYGIKKSNFGGCVFLNKKIWLYMI